ncbi:hypothetical protein, partial [Paenibacillus chondroitinus]|uniref:hypothetical protein n=1 Tax=Paenibacillus chondroitinus TaxID=59842 RepID=UPI001C3FB444
MELFLQLASIIISTKKAGDIAVRLGQPSVLGSEVTQRSPKGHPKVTQRSPKGHPKVTQRSP